VLVCGRSPAEIVGSNPTVGMDVCCECCELSGRGLCDELITRKEESYRLWCVVVCDQETSWMRSPWPALGRSATGKKSYYYYYYHFYARYLQWYNQNKPYLYGVHCCICSVFTFCAIWNVNSPVKYVYYYYYYYYYYQLTNRFSHVRHRGALSTDTLWSVDIWCPTRTSCGITSFHFCHKRLVWWGSVFRLPYIAK